MPTALDPHALRTAVRLCLSHRAQAANHAPTDDLDLAVVVGPLLQAGLDVLMTTSAPPNYDGFGTLTLERSPQGHRMVLVASEHREWQTRRYQSGLHGAVVVDPTDLGILPGP